MFKAVDDLDVYRKDLIRFLKKENHDIPVYTHSREDLYSSIEKSNFFYDSIRTINPADLMIFLDHSIMELFTDEMYPYLANTWCILNDLSHDKLNQYNNVVIVGNYKNFLFNTLQTIIESEINIGFIIGRDLQSVSWMLGKQFADVSKNKETSNGFISAIGISQDVGTAISYSEVDANTSNLSESMLNVNWNNLIIQGHGKDDHINLWNYTLCGRSCDNNISQCYSEPLRPRCGYLGQNCFKDEDKLIPVRDLKVKKLSISSCNSSPFCDTKIYDSNYQLLLAAVDGVTQNIIGSVTVHDSSIPENQIFVEQLNSNAMPSPNSLNLSLSNIHVHKPYLFFGFPDSEVNDLPWQEPFIEPKLIEAHEMVHSYINTGFIAESHSLRKRLDKISKKFNNYIQRNVRLRMGKNIIVSEIPTTSDLDSLSYAMANLIEKNPNDQIINFDNYFLDRSIINKDSVHKSICTSCNKYMQVFYKTKGLISSIPTIVNEFCYQCGDKYVAIDGGIRLNSESMRFLPVEKTVKIQVQVESHINGTAYVGMFFPSYVREYISVHESLRKIKIRGDRQNTIEFEVCIREEIPKQAYYYTVFGVQNLKISIHRKHFGIPSDPKDLK